MSRQTKEALFVYGDTYNIQERGLVDIFVSSIGTFRQSDRFHEDLSAKNAKHRMSNKMQ